MKTALKRSMLVLAVLLCSGCGGSGHESAQKRAETATPVKGVTVERVAVASVPESIELTGTVRANVSAAVTARVAGTISMLRVREGNRVKKGQLLVLLEAQENQAGATMAQEGVEEAGRSLDEALSRKKLADSTFARYEVLYGEQAITRQEFEVKQTERDLATQGVARAEARLKQARAQAQGAAATAGYTKIVAPISGIITSRQANLGSTVFPSQPLMTIDDEESYHLELSVPESLAIKLRPGLTVQVSLDAVNAVFPAKITEIVPATDPASRAFTAKIPLHRTGLASGMFGRGTIPLGAGVKGIMVARNAIVERGSITMVWVLDKDGCARMRLVKTGRTVGDKAVIASGLSDGERIAVSGLEKLTEGAKVE